MPVAAAPGLDGERDSFDVPGEVQDAVLLPEYASVGGTEKGYLIYFLPVLQKPVGKSEKQSKGGPFVAFHGSRYLEKKVLEGSKALSASFRRRLEGPASVAGYILPDFQLDWHYKV